MPDLQSRVRVKGFLELETVGLEHPQEVVAKKPKRPQAASEVFLFCTFPRIGIQHDPIMRM